MILDIQDIINSVSVPTLIKDQFIKKGTFSRLRNGDFQACVGGFSIVFPVEVDGSKWAFRCWHHTLDNDQARFKLLSAELKKAGLPYFIDFEYEDNGIVVNGTVYPTTRMKWLNGRDIKDYICYNRNNRHKLFELASNFFAMTQDLHHLSIAHGDLQHENIIVNPYGKIFLIDYDSMYIPALSYMNSKNSTNGKEGYQHPARENCVYSNPTLDYFSEVVILTSILAIAYNPSLIDKYEMEDSDTMLFKKADFRDFANSDIYSDLSSMGEIFTVLLNVLSSYLSKHDITYIDPLEMAVNKANPTNALSIADYLKNAENNLLNAEKETQKKKEKEEQEKKRQLELIAWRGACQKNTSAGYQKYLIEYPRGPHAEEAMKKKSDCEAAEDVKKNAQLDDNAWQEACNINSVEGYKKYIDTFPDGKNIHAAQQRIRRQESKKKLLKLFKWALVIVVISVIAIFAIKANYTSLAPVSKPTHIQTQPKSTDTSASINQIESELEAKLKGLELQKKRGKSLDANELNKAKSLLNKLYGKSSKYNSFKQRIDNL